jgi:peptidoglycan/xylan/chitin deacetylase (PgdA/CDA1 family)
MTLRSQLGVLRSQLLCSVFQRPVPLGSQGPVVSFCFDDFPRTAYTAGGAILKSFGARGTYYAALGLMNTTNDLGDQLKQEDIDSLLANGHELGCHTFSHISCRSVPIKSFESDVLKGRRTIRQLTGYDAANFAYPFGHVSVNSKRIIGAQMNSCRGIYGGINQPMADLNLLRANSLYGDVDQFDQFESLLSGTVSERGWLIFYTHDVRKSPSPFGCTPALLDRILALAEKKGCLITPVKDAISLFRRTSGEPVLSDSQNNLGRVKAELGDKLIRSQQGCNIRATKDDRKTAIARLPWEQAYYEYC